MELLAIVTELIGHLAWPAVLVTLVILFREEIRQSLAKVSEVKYPGGAIIMREVERLEAKVEQYVPPPSGTEPLQTSSLESLHPTDSRLAIAKMRLDAERELFLLARHMLRQRDVVGWPVHRYIEELEKTETLTPAMADDIRDFIVLANKIVHEAAVPEDVMHRAATVGSSLVAALRRERLVREAQREFEGHLLWHLSGHKEGEGDGKYHFWSAVAATLPQFDFSYEVYRTAAERYNQKIARREAPGPEIHMLPLEEFVSVLEFRESELLRIIREWESGTKWESGDEVLYWQWPHEWGEIQWNAPILRERIHLWGAEEDLMRTRAALATYRQRLLAMRRAE